MFLDDMISVLRQYKEQYPHRNIEIRGELQVKIQDGEPHECFRVVCPPIAKDDRKT
jgi:hypothetical protein